MENIIRHVWRLRKRSGTKRETAIRLHQKNKYNFEWSLPSEDYSNSYHYSKDIKKDWLAWLKECEQMLIEDGIIQDDSQMEGLEELREKQSGGMQMV